MYVHVINSTEMQTSIFAGQAQTPANKHKHKIDRN